MYESLRDDLAIALSRFGGEAMKKSVAAASSIALAFALLSADIARAAEVAAVHSEQSQRGEVRRQRNLVCGIGGVVLGIAAGLIFGNRRDGFNENAAIIGGGGAALICGAVWSSVAREDQDDVNRKVGEMTLDPNATTQTYTSAVTGRTYTITAGETTYRTRNNEFTTIAEVDAPQRGYKVSSAPYQVNAAVLNLRATPGSETSDRITGAFYRNDIVQSLSESPDGQWVLVGYDDVGYGWVARRYLLPVATRYDQISFARPAPPLTPAEIATASAPPPPPPRAVPRRGRTRARPAPATPVAVARRMTTVPPTRTQQVRTQMACRQMGVSDGQRSDRNRSCAGPRGAILMG
jgi:Bacterial SH3 domain